MPPAAERRILICDDLHAAALERFRARGFEPQVRTGMDEAQLLAAVPGVHALVVRSATRITRAVLEAADCLEVVGRAGVGVDNVDLEAATERGVVVMNTPTGNTTATAELALALLAALARHLPLADRRTRSGQWDKQGLMGTELTGKTLGVIGLGRIGGVVARRALGLEMEVVASDPYLSKTGADSPVEGVELLELDDLLARSDFVTLHVPLTDATRGLLSEERLARMKPGARLINCARGGLVDEHALARALDEGRLAGAALDVLSEEPPGPDHPLVGRDDVILTPHLGASSHEAQEKVAVQVAEQIAAYFTEGVAHNAVNAPALPAQARRELAPYLLVAEKMGTYLAQRLSEPIRKVEFTLAGEIARKDHGALKLAFLAAVLRQSLDRAVNFVNAPVLAKQRGIRLLESSDPDAENYQNLIKVRASSKGGTQTHLVCGTVFGQHPRFVRVDDMHVDFEPVGCVLLTRHTDQPGVLGALGTLLGQAGVNIRRVELGPPTESSQGLASAFLTLYDRPPPEVIESIRALEPIQSAQLVNL
ncbi:MAG: phosphoglycerate dehydrogenase [Planctomycetota bacterium]